MSLDSSDLNQVDLFFLVIFLLSIVWGCYRGFLKELLSLLSLLISVLLARHFTALLAETITTYLEMNRSVAIGFSALAIIIMAQSCLAVVTRLIVGIMRFSGLSLIDRISGAIFGFVRGGIIATVCLMATKGIDPILQSAQWRESQLIPYISVYEHWMSGLFGDVWARKDLI